MRPTPPLSDYDRARDDLLELVDVLTLLGTADVDRYPDGCAQGAFSLCATVLGWIDTRMQAALEQRPPPAPDDLDA